MVIIDGQELPDSALDPKQHRFIGMFRPATYPVSDGNWDVYVCSCGAHLWSVEQCQDHWLKGHMDLPQYLSIENTKMGPKNPGNFSENKNEKQPEN